MNLSAALAWLNGNGVRLEHESKNSPVRVRVDDLLVCRL